jgi:hypothetical protein
MFHLKRCNFGAGWKLYAVSSELHFLELEVAFCKPYYIVQNDELVYMALRIIKQGNNKRVEVYYEWIFKLTNCLQHKANDNLLITFFQIGLVPYLRITTVGMKWDTLFEHNEFVVTYEETMANVEKY